MPSLAAACAGNDCPTVGHIDRVEVLLPPVVADDGLALRMCVDELCGDDVVGSSRHESISPPASSTPET
jgi:hypothetical protein